MLGYDEILKLPRKAWSYTYSIHQDPTDQKIYNLNKETQEIELVRDPLNTKFTKGQIVLVKPVDEYGEIVEVNKDPDWGNHTYNVKIFNNLDCQSGYCDEYELEPLENTE